MKGDEPKWRRQQRERCCCGWGWRRRQRWGSFFGNGMVCVELDVQFLRVYMCVGLILVRRISDEDWIQVCRSWGTMRWSEPVPSTNRTTKRQKTGCKYKPLHFCQKLSITELTLRCFSFVLFKIPFRVNRGHRGPFRPVDLLLQLFLFLSYFEHWVSLSYFPETKCTVQIILSPVLSNISS